ncbi:hypothetical protein ACVIU7_004689 [Bradyrhizobium liaoningense]|uniref:hypothetical protein n=1 Tax=Bradyrhizobium TaxID=374 RepID=UPI000428FC04|nr:MULTISPECIES: hypothetical protein [Bradyrhizobium]WLB86661.1 hypothetical protein QIH91_27835 [Bradyrhizobium japonicum USDA 135]GLR97926.1 hypothetical protein GCM10007858_55680 [Bradyrhizobium liaoningense]
MLNVRLVTTSLAMLVVLMAAAAAEPVKDQAPVVQSSAEARPIRVILPAPWETTQSQGEPVKSSK